MAVDGDEAQHKKDAQALRSRTSFYHTKHNLIVYLHCFQLIDFFYLPWRCPKHDESACDAASNSHFRNKTGHREALHTP